MPRCASGLLVSLAALPVLSSPPGRQKSVRGMGIVLFYFEEIAISIRAEVVKQVAVRFANRKAEAQKNGKILTFLWVTIGSLARVSGFENPCVGGSIPPQATRFKRRAPMRFLKTTQVVTCGNSSVGRAIPCQGIGREFEPLFPLQICLDAKSPSNAMGFLLVGAPDSS